jgi:hypothetical protein
MTSAPFPVLPHRTGPAELPHPASPRLASPQGTRRGNIMAGVLGTAHHVPRAVRRMKPVITLITLIRTQLYDTSSFHAVLLSMCLCSTP